MKWNQVQYLQLQCRPYIVNKQVKLMAYCLKLSPTIRKLHLVFNTIKLTTTLKDLISGCCSEIPDTIWSYPYKQKK